MSLDAFITTSWDDGHPFDLRVADMLAKYGLPGTFYVPRTAANGTMATDQLRELSRAFEIGAHTLDHVVLTRATPQRARSEIADCKSWLEDITGRPCLMFCPPEGRYANRHLGMIRNAGYLGLRSVELGSLDSPRVKAGLALMPTSVQAHPHGPVALCRNAVKRAAFGNLARCFRHAGSTDWVRLAESFQLRVAEGGGVFHLWGHSWEVQQTGQWQGLDEVLRTMSELMHRATPLTNGRICQRFVSTTASKSS